MADCHLTLNGLYKTPRMARKSSFRNVQATQLSTLINWGDPAPSSAVLTTSRHQLYLLKKQLRLERSGLKRGWAEGVAIASTSKKFPNTVGKALLDRYTKTRRRRGPRRVASCLGVGTTTAVKDKITDQSLLARRCCQQSREIGRCPALCLPYSNHCYKHILYNIDQRLFRYCSEPNCQLPVLDLGMPPGAPGGPLCPRHTDRKLWMGPRARLDSSGSSGGHLTLAGYKRKTAKKYLLLRKHKRRKKTKGASGEQKGARTLGGGSPPLEEPEETSEDGRTSAGSSVDRMSPNNAEETGANTSGLEADVFSGPLISGTCSSGGRSGGGAVDNDVSLASVAKDLGFEDHELTEMLNKFPDEAFSSIMSQDFGKNGDHLIRVEDQASLVDAMVVAAGGSAVPPGAGILPPGTGPPTGDDIPVPPSSHSWADVEQFLLSEGYTGSSFGDVTGPGLMSPPPPYPSGGGSSSWCPPTSGV